MTTMPVQQTFADAEIWEPLYRIRVVAAPFEAELLRSAPLRRLKHLHHYGAGALFSPVTHSRYEHTVGVWSLVRHFFPDDIELRAAAILHDIGHLPFSHSIEQALEASHHHLTEEAIVAPPVSAILRRHGLSPERIVALLNEDSPLTHKTNYLGIDHMDSFLRDTYMTGRFERHPSDIVQRIRFNGNFIETDDDNALHLTNAVLNDNETFLDPHFLAMCHLLSRAVNAYCSDHPSDRTAIWRMTDYELLSLLQSSPNPTVRGLVHAILTEPHRIELCEEQSPGAVPVTVRKAYVKQPMVQGRPFSEACAEAGEALTRIAAMARTYHYRLRPSGSSL